MRCQGASGYCGGWRSKCPQGPMFQGGKEPAQRCPGREKPGLRPKASSTPRAECEDGSYNSKEVPLWPAQVQGWGLPDQELRPLGFRSKSQPLMLHPLPIIPPPEPPLIALPFQKLPDAHLSTAPPPITPLVLNRGCCECSGPHSPPCVQPLPFGSLEGWTFPCAVQVSSHWPPVPLTFS